MTKSKIDYDVKEASWKFAFLKIVEISIIFVIVFGFYFIGIYANNLPKGSCNFKVGLSIPCPHTDTPTFLNLWAVGVGFCFLIIFTLVIWAVILAIAVGIIYLIILVNWNWAIKWAETYDSKRKKLIEKEKKLRYDWGILEDDIVQVKENLKIGEKYGNIKFVKKMKPYEGEVGKVLRLDEDDHTYRLNIDGREYWWTIKMLKIKERRENPFIKKLDEDPRWKNKK